MFRRSQQSHVSNAESALVGILGDEQAAAIQASLAQLHLKVAALEEQMRSQYTSVAAYASIAHEQVEFTRNEARADLDRTRQTLIELVEQVRREASAGPEDSVRPAHRRARSPRRSSPRRALPWPPGWASSNRRSCSASTVNASWPRRWRPCSTSCRPPRSDAPISGLAFT